MSAGFVHLRVHTEYSLFDGLVRLKELIKATAAAGMPAVGVTDQSNLFAMVKLYEAGLGAGIKPVLGVDLWVMNDDDPTEDPTRLTLLIRNGVGYRNLMELVSRAFKEGQGIIPDRAMVKREWVKEKAEGLIALSGARMGDIGRAVLNGHEDQAEFLLSEWMQVFPDSFYLEIQRTGRPGDETIVHASVELARKQNCPLVATNEVMFLKAEDFEAHETRVCINLGRTLDDPQRPHNYSDQQYFRTAEEMEELFSDIPSALANTLEIAKRCNITIELGTYYLPRYPIPDGILMDDYFRHLAEDGLEKRLDFLYDRNDPNFAEIRKPYDERLKFELDIIIQMGFPGYYLIVMDFIDWSKNNGVPVGPGRGSGAGSLVAYALTITDLDPLKYDLLFERFLNPERVSMPDFDVDFCMDNRERTIDYVAGKYGRDAVSQIVTFGTMAAKAVVRDVARVQGKPFGLADRLSKLIPFEVGMTLSKAWEQEEALREFVNSSEEAQEIMEMAYKLEGITRNTGKHAGGVVIAPTKLTDFSATQCDEEGHNLVTQFDKHDVEEAGLVKFDFLGLRTLTIIDWALEMIDNLRGEDEDPLNIDRIDLEDPATFKLLQAAQTTAVFQLESSGMKDLIRRLQPSCFEDIIALVALFRPGPLQSGMVDDFIDRKHGRAPLAWPHPDYQHESLQPVLEPTYGIILYQEQVMQIAQVLAGYTLGGADMLRRAMGKKKPEEMAKQRSVFLEGAKSKGIEESLASNIFDLVEKFAGYGFNKSHSAAYALVSYQTAWLKTHHPAPFMAAVMSSDMQNTEKVVIFIEECRQMGMEVRLPNVNLSEYKFTVRKKGEVIYGLGAVKGVGEGPVDAIVEARKQGGPFTDLFDFCKRVGNKKLNKRVLEALVRSGALDDLGAHRAILWEAIGDALQAADQQARDEDAGMFDLFGEIEEEQDSDPYEYYRNIEEWGDKVRLGGEKDTLGLYVTGHPIDEYEHELKHFIHKRLVEVQPARGRVQKMAGLIVDLRMKKTRKGDPLCFVTLDDRSARMEVTLFGESYEAAKKLLIKDEVVIIEGEVAQDDYNGGLKVRGNQVLSIAQARAHFAQSMELYCTRNDLEKAAQVRKLREILESARQPDRAVSVPVTLRYRRDDAEAMLQFDDNWRVEASDNLLTELQQVFGRESVQLCYEN